MPTLDESMLGLPGRQLRLLPAGARGSHRRRCEGRRFLYRLRYSLGLLPPNQNPVISGLEGVAVQNPGAALSSQPSPEPFAESTPIEVGVNERRAPARWT